MIVLDKKSLMSLGYELYTLECSHCGRTFVFPDGHTHTIVPETARAKAVLYGWFCAKGKSAFYTGGNDFCEKCKELKQVGHLTDYANKLIDNAEARKKRLAEWSKPFKSKKDGETKNGAGKGSGGVLGPLIEIPFKTAPVPKEDHVAPALEKTEPPPRPDIPLEPIDEVIRFAFSTVLIYPGMDRK